MDLLKIINEIRINKGLSPVDKLDDSIKLREDLMFDSLDLAELTVKIEAQTNIDIFSNGIVDTIREITNQLKD